MNRAALFLTLTLAVSIIAGCDSRDETARYRDGSTAEIVESITSTDNNVDLVLTTRSVYMQLSEKMLEEIQDEIADERADDEGSELGNTIKNAVLENVESMLAKRIEYPLEEVNAIYWKKGAIVIDVEDENFISFDDVEIDDDPALESFRESDARDLINAFDRLKDEKR